MMTCQQPMSSLNTTFPTSLSTSAISSSVTASSMLSGTAWRRNLARLSKKWKTNTRHLYPHSGTVAAAATEKIIKRPKATIQTEDLTASQFADMAGIKIKRGRNHQDTEQLGTPQQLMYDEDSDDDTGDDSDDTEDDDTDGMHALSLDHPQIRQLTTKATKMHHGSIPGMTSYSTSLSTAQYHPIWDVRFWQQHNGLGDIHSGQNQDNKTSTPASPAESILSSSSGRHSGLSLSTTDTCISNSLSSTSLSSATCSSSSSSSAPKPRVFHKGRFQIVLGGDDTTKLSTEPLIRTISSESKKNVVEWHRKRTLTQ
ncbi:hypothetical protein BCR42DRAFT_402669 [Absidia repens]|uniref:Uncharacterized protein n=1 Tax=Absidia repens TaxID=90262 RepID=A0A1X2IYD8_9FUNG|nr:hypothetical protein BCR42DRAFT_402669 [Absidia repens]